MRYEPGMREDAKNLSIIAGSALLTLALTGTLLARATQPGTPAPAVPTESPSTGPGDVVEQHVIIMTPSHRTELVKTHTHAGVAVHNGRRVTVSRSTGDGNRVVTVTSGNGAQVISVGNSKETATSPKP